MTDTALLSCPSCGEPTAEGDRFCEACGHELAPAPAEATASASSAAASPADPADPVAAASAADPAAASLAAAPAEACPSCGSPAEWLDGYCGVCGARRPAARDHAELSLPGVAAVTDRGRRHYRNEDAFAVAASPVLLALVVCDGVSTTVVSDEASQAAADAALAVLLAGDGSAPELERAFTAAREAVLAVQADPHPTLGPPSCTFLAATLAGDADGAEGAAAVHLAAFGDCRAYWLAADGTVSQLTVDDSWATTELSAGRAPEVVWADPRAHSITRWLGSDADPAWRPAVRRFDVPGPGRLLLCSDGLWNYTLEEAHLAVLVAETGPTTDLLALARHLVEFANDAGGADNITVVVADLPRPSAGSGGTPEGS